MTCRSAKIIIIFQCVSKSYEIHRDVFNLCVFEPRKLSVTIHALPQMWDFINVTQSRDIIFIIKIVNAAAGALVISPNSYETYVKYDDEAFAGLPHLLMVDYITFCQTVSFTSLRRHEITVIQLRITHIRLIRSVFYYLRVFIPWSPSFILFLA